ncbi:hypothetical protein PACTADRAFT_38622 [Pachysolen tannophilus NRRL Y-2460]|uniref:CBS domain-containing protein n=1 Tax=Pachysolen tannophilus NRRL Y-2460 TaxID=669874 RepID=A0A1E4U0J7_PACTA|nr:hypothetical protein PACTADRAFT_38622 [Pachysolen tannophilus NRRL Y-2460]
MTNKYPGSPFRSPTSPSLRSRQTSIVEMLSTPPPLENNLDVSSFQLNNDGAPSQRAPSMSSLSSLHHNHNHNSGESQVPAGLSRNPSSSSQASSATQGSFSYPLIDWQDIPLAELVEKNKLIFIDSKVSVEKAFETLIKNNLTSVPVEQYPNDLNCLTFDYTDLNSYLLLVLNKLKIIDVSNINYTPKEEIPQLIQKAQRGEQVPVDFVIRLTTKNQFIKLSETDTLSTVVEILGSGVHRVAITSNDHITGILSQRRLIKFLWDNARRFPSLEPLLTSSIGELQIGQSNVISIFGDQLLIDALITMHELKISSLAVVDRSYNLLGNISVTDVKHVSNSSKSDLLYKSCLHFISVILNSRGLENGKDSFPIFHVTPYSSLGRTIAKLVATQSHRLWIVKPYGAPAAGSEEYLKPNTQKTPVSGSSTSSSGTPLPSYILEKESGRPGKLIGVVSLTDILSLFAKKLGKQTDPELARRQRHRSSSASNAGSIGEQIRKSFSGHPSPASTNSNPLEFR